jgi:glycosyltransferase involved in cell wall biosynthesis
VRVIFLTNHYPRWSGDSSGAAISTLARAVMRRGISLRVIAPSDEKTGEGELDGVPVYRVKAPSKLCDGDAGEQGVASALLRPAQWGKLIRLHRALKAAARRELAAGTAVIHAHWWLPAGLASPPGAPVVLTIQGTDAALLRHSRLARTLARRLLRRVSVVTSISREASSWVQSGVGRHVSQTHIHPMPIETRGRPWTRGGGGALVIGPLVAEARVELAIQATAVLAACGHDLPLTIVGDGPLRAALEQRASALGVHALVRFAGNAPPEESRRLLERADIMLCTVQGDGVAAAAIEGLVSGVPVVACWDGGAVVDIVPASGAGRLSLPSPEALADSVLSLQADSERLAMARLVGESWRARLAPDHVAQLCEGWYRDAAAG